MFFQVLLNFRKQSVSLFGQTVLDTTESKSRKTDEHMIFTWKTSSPT